MKLKLIFSLLLTLTNISLFSQNIEPAQRLFNHYGQNKLIGSHLDSFKINNFTLGWHWGGEYKNSKAMNTNQKDIESKEETDSITKGTNLFIRSVYKNGSITKSFSTHCYYSNEPIFGKSLKYDPTLYIDPNNVYKLNKRIGDPSNPVFGFIKKRGTVITDTNDVNYSRIIVRGDSLKNQIILSDPWPVALCTTKKILHK